MSDSIEVCSSCLNSNYVISKDMTSRRHCQCGNTWLPEGMGETWKAYRYDEIHHAVEQMGGWANFSYWIKRHAASYFETSKTLETENAELKAREQKLIEALRFYASPENYSQSESFNELSSLNNDLEYLPSNRGSDLIGGKRARQALAQIKEGK